MLQAVFVLEIALLAGGLLLGKPNEDGTCRLPRALRILLSALLVLAAFLGWQAVRTTPTQAYAIWVLIGMSASFVGDLVMARLIRTPSRLVFGMIAFGVGHVAYIAALGRLALRLQLPLRGACAVWLAMLAFSTSAWYTQIQRPGGSKALNGGSLLYGLLVGSMAALAIHLALHDLRFLALAVGALLFLASDFVLGNWVIRGHCWKSVNDVVWTTYVSGQLLVVYSVAAALKALS